MATPFESQVAKISIGNPKETTSFTFSSAEQAGNQQSEIYVITELPVLNPAAIPDCQRINQTLVSALRRSYRLPASDYTFETALTVINEELAKLASLGKNYWVGKLNALIAVKDKDLLSIATTGKITALLFRDGQFTHLAETQHATHPLKTFDDFAIGKLKLNDLIIFSNTQLLNFISLDRIKNILADASIQEGTEHIIKILEESTGPDAAIATIMSKQVPFIPKPQTQVSSITTEDVAAATWQERLSVIKNFAQSLLDQIPKKIRSLAKRDHPALTTTLSATETSLASGISQRILQIGNSLISPFKPSTIAHYTWEKKLFGISLIILLVASISYGIIRSEKIPDTATDDAAITQIINKLTIALENSTATALNNELQKNIEFLQSAHQLINELPDDAKNSKEGQELINKFKTLSQKAEHNRFVTPQSITTLSNTSHLLSLGASIATQGDSGIISYDTSTNKTEDNQFISKEAIADNAWLKDGLSAIHTKNGLSLWRYKVGTTLGNIFTESVPDVADSIGLVYYPINNRLYTLDTKKNQITSFLLEDDGFSRPIASVKDAADITKTADIAIDGSIYTYTSTSILKFQSGKLVGNFEPGLVTPLSGSGKLFTDANSKNIYVLDTGNNRVVILDKTGNVIETLTSPSFTNTKDFVVKESQKKIYILNGTELLQVDL